MVKLPRYIYTYGAMFIYIYNYLSILSNLYIYICRYLGTWRGLTWETTSTQRRHVRSKCWGRVSMQDTCIARVEERISTHDGAMERPSCTSYIYIYIYPCLFCALIYVWFSATSRICRFSHPWHLWLDTWKRKRGKNSVQGGCVWWLKWSYSILPRRNNGVEAFPCLVFCMVYKCQDRKTRPASDTF